MRPQPPTTMTAQINTRVWVEGLGASSNTITMFRLHLSGIKLCLPFCLLSSMPVNEKNPTYRSRQWCEAPCKLKIDLSSCLTVRPCSHPSLSVFTSFCLSVCYISFSNISLSLILFSFFLILSFYLSLAFLFPILFCILYSFSCILVLSLIVHS